MITPAPWYNCGQHELFDGDISIAAGMFSVARVICEGPDDEEALDNARLIAAAPDFFHAATTGAQVNLPDLLDWVAARLIRFGDSENMDFIHTLRDRAKLLRAAITKATGGKDA
jgi:hypothetical protein